MQSARYSLWNSEGPLTDKRFPSPHSWRPSIHVGSPDPPDGGQRDPVHPHRCISTLVTLGLPSQTISPA